MIFNINITIGIYDVVGINNNHYILVFVAQLLFVYDMSIHRAKLIMESYYRFQVFSNLFEKYY